MHLIITYSLLYIQDSVITIFCKHKLEYMVQSVTSHMTDQRRALLTEREREILSREADVTDNYRYSVESRVRKRIRDRLEGDVGVIREFYPEIFDELIYPVVCEPEDTSQLDSRATEQPEQPSGQSRGESSLESLTLDESGPYDAVNAKVIEAVRRSDDRVSKATILKHVADDLEIKPDSWWSKHGKDALEDAGADFIRNKGWGFEEDNK